MLTAIFWTLILGWLLLKLIHFLDGLQAAKYRKRNAIAAAARSAIEPEHLNTE